jgi:tetratricopeptide (TPR) repeat protein
MTSSIKKRVSASFADHIIILSILLVAALIYIGSGSFSNENRAPGQSPVSSGETAAADMADFIGELPADYESLVSMGNALMDKGRYALAIECYTRALEQNSGAVDVRSDLGTCRHALGQNEQALAEFFRVLALDPAHQIAKFNLGIVYLSLGDTTQTLHWWQKLLDENPPDNVRSRLEMTMEQIR